MTATALILPILLIAAAAQFGSIVAILYRRRILSRRRSFFRPPISILRPACGIENYLEETLGSTFAIDYPEFEAIFCVASATDPAVELIERLRARHPGIPSRLLIGDHRISINPKLNNLVKGWQAAEHEFVAMADSNLMLPPDYLDLLMARWDRGTGLVSSPAFGGRPGNLAAEFECAVLNTYQARWQLAADAIGFGFGQGKTLFWRRGLLDRAGGMRALARQPAEDAAATKVVRDAGLKVRLVTTPFEQPLGDRRYIDVWNRQLRWARLRRQTFGALFSLEILSGGFVPLAGAVALAVLGVVPTFVLLLFVAAWYGAEMLLARLSGWPLSWRSPFVFLGRDLMLPVLWAAAWTGSTFVWRGNAMDMRDVEEERDVDMDDGDQEAIGARAYSFTLAGRRAMRRWMRRG